jgi:hypothetical protein
VSLLPPFSSLVMQTPIFLTIIFISGVEKKLIFGDVNRKTISCRINCKLDNLEMHVEKFSTVSALRNANQA